MRIVRRTACVVATVSILAGCHRKAPQATISQVLPNIPLPPDPEPLVRMGGTEAMEFIVVSHATVDSVVAYYSRLLSSEPFRLINVRKSGNTTAFYAEQNGPSLWVTVSPNGTDESQVIIAGATDTTAAKSGTVAKEPAAH